MLAFAWKNEFLLLSFICYILVYSILNVTWRIFKKKLKHKLDFLTFILKEVTIIITYYYYIMYLVTGGKEVRVWKQILLLKNCIYNRLSPKKYFCWASHISTLLHLLDFGDVNFLGNFLNFTNKSYWKWFWKNIPECRIGLTLQNHALGMTQILKAISNSEKFY